MTILALTVFVIAILLQWADVETTNRVLDGGKGGEANPIVRWAMLRLFGGSPYWWLWKFLMLLYIGPAWFFWGDLGLLLSSGLLAVLTAFAVRHNLQQLQQRKKTIS